MDGEAGAGLHYPGSPGDEQGALLTREERELVRDLGSIYTRLSAIAGTGPTRDADLVEAAGHVHVLQNMIKAQAAGRAYPGEFRLLGEVIAVRDQG